MTSSSTSDNRERYLGRITSIGERKVAIVVRVSSQAQVNNGGSLDTQRRQASLVRGLVSQDQITWFEILGESAKDGARRPKFNDFVDQLDTGAFGLVIVYDFDRLARNGRDEARLIAVMKRHQILLLSKGYFYDPTDPADELMWKLLSTFAAYDNALRTFRGTMAKAAKANAGRLAITPPAGLGWYALDDVAYRAAAEALGMGSYLLATEGATVYSDSGGVRRCILPAPDPETFAACRLLMQYMREERSLEAVLDRVKSTASAEWPSGRAGLIPVLNKTRRRRRETAPLHTGSRVAVWEPASLTSLSQFYLRPAYYGIYALKLSSLAGAMARHAEKIGLKKTVWIEGGFLGFATPAEYHDFKAIIANTVTVRRRPAGAFLRIHALPPVVCAELVRDPETGKHVPCGYRLSPTYGLPGRGNVYMSAGACPHHQQLSHKVEPAVLDLIAECINPNQLAEMIKGQTLRKRNTEELLRTLSADLAALDDKVRQATDYLAELAAEARIDPSKASQKVLFEARLTELGEERDAMRRKIERARVEAERDESVTMRELAMVRQLSHDLPRLFRNALSLVRRLPDEYAAATTEAERTQIRERAAVLRNLVAHLVRRISARRIGRAVHEITVEFRHGGTATTIVATTGTRATQAQQAWLSHHVGGGEDFDGAGAALTDFLGDRKHPWDALDVRTAVVHHRKLGAPLRGAVMDVGQLAERIGQPESAVLKALLPRDDVRMDVRAGHLVVKMDMPVLHAALPRLGLLDVADRMGWSPGRTVALDEHAPSKADRRRERDIARRENRYAEDASGRAFIALG